MILLNFSHPLTAEHLEQLAALAGEAVDQVIDLPVQVDPGRSLAAQMAEMVDQVGMSPRQWQNSPLLVNLPGYAPAAAALLAELHGRMGHFPSIIWLRPVPDRAFPGFQVAEVVNLQNVRDLARTRRTDESSK